MINAGIIGASGLTGRELIKILLRHPQVNLVYATSRGAAGKALASYFPQFNGLTQLKFVKPSPKIIYSGVDLAFVCLPHTEAMETVAQLAKKGIKAIDLSADYRIKNPKEYEKWYKTKHKYTALLKKAVFGLPELNRCEIAGAGVIANPGCFATSIILGLYPAMKKLKFTDIIVDSKTGISGAGAAATDTNRYININENVIPYKYGRSHRHIGEIEHVLKGATGKNPNIIFTPQLTSLDRGILSVIYIKLASKISAKKAKEIYQKAYAQEPFVRIVDAINLHAVQNTNFCDIAVDAVEEKKTLMIFSAIDNLVKGASGQAVQNMNIMYGFDEAEGLK